MSAGSSFVRGPAVAFGLILAGDLALSPRAVAAEREAGDAVRLRDGRVVEGRVVEQAPGRWLVVETEDGRRRTFAWDTVDEVDVGAAPRPAAMHAATEDAWRRRSGVGVTYELRLSLSAIALPDQTFGVSGTCSTGTGTAPASMYGQTASDGAVGFGGGLGGRLGFMHRSRLDPDGASSWWGFRAVAGLDLHAHHVRGPVGIPPLDGAICSKVAKDSHQVAYESSTQLVASVPLVVGGLVALGKLDAARWKGVVLGAGWSPSFTHFGLASSAATSYLNPLGLELTFDVTVIHAVPVRPEPHLRVAFFFAPPTDAQKPAIGTLSVGAVWY
ncbi:MAG: hypothetical protein KF764_16710 [Labilithrix sp.]|nr:hypothetical protein [Labilithrix sp.]MBX3220926.1 hypothetical protein [Labilithrix sp.]